MISAELLSALIKNGYGVILAQRYRVHAVPTSFKAAFKSNEPL